MRWSGGPTVSALFRLEIEQPGTNNGGLGHKKPK